MSDDPTYRGYQIIPDMTQVNPDMAAVNWSRVIVDLSGKTNNAHEDLVLMIQKGGHIKVFNPEEADYCLLFCTITSRVESDMASALRHSPDKPTILVLMYHTTQANYIIPETRRLAVDDPRVKLTVSCLFFEKKLLSCNRNTIARREIRRFLGFPLESQAMTPCVGNRKLLIGFLVLVVVVGLIILLAVLLRK